ncbi:MAG: SH3 domain-containing protein [Anaerolineaceae bacterium]|nr:SH3 domain-containing protein [Anaerolineaceae bacterium]
MKRIRSTLIAVLTVVTMIIAVVPILTVQADYGTNWQATFYNRPDLTGTAAGPIVVPNGLNFTWLDGPPNVNGASVPLAGCQAVAPATAASSDGGNSPGCNNYFSARFTSTQNLTPGQYNFVVSSDDGVRLYVNGALVLDKWFGRALTTDNISVNVSTSPVNLTVEYFEGYDQATLQVQWFLVAGGATAIPGQTLVYGTVAPVTTAVPPFTVTVAGVKAEALRTGPYLGASMIGEVAAGNPLTPLARNKDEGIYNWYLVNTGTKTGWISGRYVTVTGDLNSIPLQSTVFEQIDGAPDVGVLAVPRSVMNLRKRPSIRSPKILEVAWGAETALIGRTVQGGRNFWLQVRLKTGEVGWIFAPYVSIRGDVNAVPIR